MGSLTSKNQIWYGIIPERTNKEYISTVPQWLPEKPTWNPRNQCWHNCQSQWRSQYSPSQRNNFRKTRERWNYKWTLCATILHHSPKTKKMLYFILCETQKVQLLEECLAKHIAFLEFADILRATGKPPTVLTDNKSVARFFQTKALLPTLWIASSYVFQLNFEIAPTAGSINSGAEVLSRL